MYQTILSTSHKRLRVAFDMTLLESRVGGSGAYARGLLDALLTREDLDVRAIAAPKRGAANTLGWMWSGAEASLLAEQADVLHSPGFIAPMSPSVPLVMTIHDLSLGKMPEGHAVEWQLYYRLLLPRIVRRAAAIIVPTEATKYDVIKEFSIAADKIAITPYGIDAQFLRQVDGAAPRNPAEPRILFTGPPIKRKNLDLVLSVLGAPPAGGLLARARLSITGATADQYPAYRQVILDRGLGHRVEWLGTVPHEQLPGLYASSDVFVYPSFLEGFGFPPLEAMAVGTPVVASNASCLPEVLGDGALLVDPKDKAGFARAVETLLEDASTRKHMIDAGRSRARMFTWARCADLTTALYEKVAEAR
jgi:glycosyltransferase involved in cell wall biosynthesis